MSRATPVKAERTTGRTGWAVAVCGLAVVGAGVDGAATATRAVMYGGVLAACGLTLFQTLAHDGRGQPDEQDRLRSLVLIGAATGVAATMMGLLLQIAAASGRGWIGSFDGDAADIVFGSSAHLGAAQRVVGLVLIAYAADRRAERADSAALLGVCGVLITLTSLLVAGHAATREPRSVGYVIDLVHTATASIWVGGLIGLAVLLRERRPHDSIGAAVVVRRFSLAAAASVSLLLATGLGLSWAEVGPSHGVPFNAYGLVLLAKASTAVAALSIGAINHFIVVPGVERGDGWDTLAKTLRIELAAVVVLVALTGLLTGLDPAPA